MGQHEAWSCSREEKERELRERERERERSKGISMLNISAGVQEMSQKFSSGSAIL